MASEHYCATCITVAAALHVAAALLLQQHYCCSSIACGSNISVAAALLLQHCMWRQHIKPKE